MEVVTDQDYPEVPKYESDVLFDTPPSATEMLESDMVEDHYFMVVATSQCALHVPTLLVRLADFENQLQERVGTVRWQLPIASLQAEQPTHGKLRKLYAQLTTDKQTIMVIEEAWGNTSG